MRLLLSPGVPVVAAFVVRLAVLVSLFRAYDMMAVHDAVFGGETGDVAASIARGHGFSSPLPFFETGPTAWFTPVFPYLLAAIFKLYGIFSFKSHLIIDALDCAFSALTCLPIALIGNKISGKACGLLAAWIWVVLPGAVYYPVYWVWDTALAGLWLALLVAATLELRGSRRPVAWMAFGVMWAIGAMINPSLLTILPALGLWAIWPLRHDLKRTASLAALSSAVFLFGIAPWTARNYVVFHQLVPLRSNFGLELWLGNNPEVPDSWTPNLHPAANVREAFEYATMTELPYMRQKQRLALAFMRAHPDDTASFIFHRFADTWLGIYDPPRDIWRSVPLKVKLMIATCCLLSLFSFAGVLFGCHARRDWAVPMASILLIFPLLFYLTHPSERYLYPMDPVMAVLSAYTVLYPLQLLIARWRAFRPEARPAVRISPTG